MYHGNWLDDNLTISGPPRPQHAAAAFNPIKLSHIVDIVERIRNPKWEYIYKLHVLYRISERECVCIWQMYIFVHTRIRICTHIYINVIVLVCDENHLLWITIISHFPELSFCTHSFLPLLFYITIKSFIFICKDGTKTILGNYGWGDAEGLPLTHKTICGPKPTKMNRMDMSPLQLL